MRIHAANLWPASAAEIAARVDWRALPWRRIAVDAGLLLLFVLTSSWFARN